MRPLFPAWSNTALAVVITGVVLTGVGIPSALIAWAHSPFAKGQHQQIVQPVAFDHRHHVRDDGIDCLYCHAGATRSSYAGVPSTELCMGCHSQIWTDSPELAAVRESARSQTPIAWRRVNALPAFVYFDHRIHVAKGVGCVSCHGRVDLMGKVFADRDLTMDWCLDCHRDPAVHLRPASEITNMEWYPEGTPRVLGEAIQSKYDVHPRTDCTTCHR
jgi:hypothetical protein